MCQDANFGTIDHTFVSGDTRSRFGSGGLVIYNYGKINKSQVEGNVNAITSVGLAAYNYESGIIIDSHAKNTVKGAYAGGLAAFNDGTIKNSNSSGTVLSPMGPLGEIGAPVGGFVGTNSATGVIKNCFATGNVYTYNLNSRNVVATNSGKIRDSYATGQVLDCSLYK